MIGTEYQTETEIQQKKHIFLGTENFSITKTEKSNQKRKRNRKPKNTDNFRGTLMNELCEARNQNLRILSLSSFLTKREEELSSLHFQL